MSEAKRARVAISAAVTMLGEEPEMSRRLADGIADIAAFDKQIDGATCHYMFKDGSALIIDDDGYRVIG